MKYLPFLLALSIATFVQAQSSALSDLDTDTDLRSRSENAELRFLSNSLTDSRGVSASDVQITQVGTNHRAIVETQAAFAQPSTEIEILQYGGDGNVATLTLIGGNSDIGLTQEGSGNVYTGELAVDGARLEVLQRGNDNTITQRMQLDADTDMMIRQVGDGNVLDASNVSSPIRVTQRDGARATLSTFLPSSGAN